MINDENIGQHRWKRAYIGGSYKGSTITGYSTERDSLMTSAGEWVTTEEYDMAKKQEREDREELIDDLTIKYYGGTQRLHLARRAKVKYNTSARRAFRWLFENYHVTLEPKVDPDATAVKVFLEDIAEAEAMANFDIYLKVYRKGKEDAVPG